MDSRISSSALQAPLYIAWQITNECNLRCLHCIEDSGPGRAFKDELSKDDIFQILDQIAEAGVPYMSFSGGEPMVHPNFREMCEFITDKGMALKIETNGHFITDEVAQWFQNIGVRAVQISLDGAAAASHNKMRVRGRFEAATDACRTLAKHRVPLEINFVPARFNMGEIGAVVDLAYELGAFSFYTGKIMYTGNAVRTWNLLEPVSEDYDLYFAVLREKVKQYEGKMKVFFHDMGLLEELKYRLENPAALFIILPNGKVKLINAMPFVCGDLRRTSLAEVWQKFQKAWGHPKVAEFVGAFEKDPKIVSHLHEWVEI